MASVKKVAALLEIKSLNVANNQEVYCEETRTRYRFHANGSRYYANDLSVLASTLNADARWVAISGKYKYNPVIDPGELKPGDLVIQRLNIKTLAALANRYGFPDEVIHVEENRTSYRYLDNAASIPVNGYSVLATIAGGDTRWIGVEGPQMFVNLLNRSSASGGAQGFDVQGDFSGAGASTLEIQDQGVTVKIGPHTINFNGPNVTAQETVPGSGIVDVFIGTPAPTPSFSITSFTVSPNLLEVGTNLVNPTFNYATSPSPATSLTINNGIGAAPLPTGPFTPTATFTSPASPGSLTFNMLGTLTSYPNANAATTVLWRSKMYWGAIPDQSVVLLSSLTYSDLIGTYGASPSDNQFATSRSITKTFNASGGRYIFFLYPTSFGIATPQLQVGPFPVTLPPGNINTAITFTNESGGVTSYTMLITDIQYGASLTVTVL